MGVQAKSPRISAKKANKANMRIVAIDASPTVRSFLAVISTEAGVSVPASGNDGRDVVRPVKEPKKDNP